MRNLQIIITRFVLFFLKNFGGGGVYVSVSVCQGVHVGAGAQEGQGCHIPWNWSQVQL